MQPASARFTVLVLVLLIAPSAGCLAPEPGAGRDDTPALRVEDTPVEGGDAPLDGPSALGLTDAEALAIAQAPARAWREDAVLVEMTGSEFWGAESAEWAEWEDPVPGDGRLLAWSLTFWSNATKNRMDVHAFWNGSHALSPPHPDIDAIEWNRPHLEAWHAGSDAAAAAFREDARWAAGIGNATGRIVYTLGCDMGCPGWQAMLTSHEGDEAGEPAPPLAGFMDAMTGESNVFVFAW